MTVPNTSVLEFPTGYDERLDRQYLEPDLSDNLPQVPVLAETLLAMEFALHEWRVDLRAISNAVLGDLGATIQVLRLAGREYGSAADRPSRIEDCISDLGVRACLEAASSGAVLNASRDTAVTEMWAHAKEIATCCRIIAEGESGILHSHEAYLGGLLHGLDALPVVLRWNRHAGCQNLSSVRLAERWAFPAFLKEFLSDDHLPSRDQLWAQTLRAAHLLAANSRERCPLSKVRF